MRRYGEKESVSAEWHGARVRKDGKKARQNIGMRDRENMSRVSLTEDTRQYE